VRLSREFEESSLPPCGGGLPALASQGAERAREA
jgi:hypothetical protein